LLGHETLGNWLDAVTSAARHIGSRVMIKRTDPDTVKAANRFTSAERFCGERAER